MSFSAAKLFSGGFSGSFGVQMSLVSKALSTQTLTTNYKGKWSAKSMIFAFSDQEDAVRSFVLMASTLTYESSV